MLVLFVPILTKKKQLLKLNKFIINTLHHWADFSALFLFLYLTFIRIGFTILFVMTEKIHKSGKVDTKFYYFLEANFGFDNGMFVLTPSWHGRSHPCKFDIDTRKVCNGYGGNECWLIEEDAYWEITQIDEYFMLKIWDKEFSKEEGYLPTYTFVIEKCITLPRLEHLDMDRFNI